MSQLVQAIRAGLPLRFAGADTHPEPLSTRTIAAARSALAEKSLGWRHSAAFAGPAVVASVAYMDPGNFATNIQAGSRYGYDLLWVVLLANLVAMLFQALSAKLGLVTGRNLAELSREHFPPSVVWTMWVVSEIAAMATDLAEFLGGAIGLSLMLNVSLLTGMAATGVIVYGLLSLQRFGFRPIELAIGGLVAAIGASYLLELLIAPVDWSAAAQHSLLPRLANGEALLIAVGIIGATVMPHALYLHSGLVQARIPPRTETDRARLLCASNREVAIALTFAGLVNLAMVLMAAAAFHDGRSDIGEIATAYESLTPLLGTAAADAFLFALLASGMSSSVVGTMAGQMIMQGFVGFAIPLWLRRLATMSPAFIVVASGADPTHALVLSQVVLSAALPFPMIALVYFTGRADLLGRFVNRRVTQLAAISGTALVLALNVFLIVESLAA